MTLLVTVCRLDNFKSTQCKFEVRELNIVYLSISISICRKHLARVMILQRIDLDMSIVRLRRISLEKRE